ncbi:MAG: ABC transporter ATP-binding protein [Eubacteriales bacterium]|nr:ABC transporter ATP-binding protein [Eubacteriales bacterium]
MRQILKRLQKEEWGQAVLALLLIIGQVWLDLKMPEYMSEITRLTQTPGSAIGDIWLAGAKMLSCALASMAATVMTGLIVARVAAAVSRRLRSQLFTKVLSFSTQEMRQFTTDSLITRSTNDITQVQLMMTLGVQVMIKAPIMAVWALAKIAGKGWQWTTATAAAVLLLCLVITVIMLSVMPKIKKMQVLTDDLNRVTRENLNGLRVIRAYNAADYQGQKFEQANENLTATQLFVNRRMAVLFPMISALISVINLAIYWIGAIVIDRAALTERLTLFSDMVVFSSYAMQVIMSFMMMVMIFILLPRASVSAHRINEVLETQTVLQPGTVNRPLEDERRGAKVEFRHVSFAYPDAAEPVLEDISFCADAGETVAFIGSTGSGKSTLLQLIPRFYDVSAGEVLIDGVDVRDYSWSSLYRRLGFVPQKARLFKGDIYSNVAFGDQAEALSEAAVEMAIEVAQASEFVTAKEGGLHAPVAQGGSNLSGGQKQRLSIARSIARNPRVYLFDDSFSALDYQTDRSLRAALRAHTNGATVLIVAQRIGTIIDADRIIVLDEGRVVGSGTHRQLLEECAVYREIALSQLSEEELAAC